jgi:hypothetical protein
MNPGAGRTANIDNVRTALIILVLLHHLQIVLFEKPGEHNTPECVEIIKKAVSEGLSKHVMDASTSGRNAEAFFNALREQT